MPRYIESFSCNNSPIYVLFLSAVLAVTCPSISQPLNGSIAFSEPIPGFMTTASYSCHTGFGLTAGDKVRVCVESSVGPGEWSGTAPSCEGKFYYSQI